MNAVFSLSRTGLALLGGAVLFLAGCSEPEVILPGEREDIRSIGEERQVEDFSGNISRALRLPKQSANASWVQAQGTPSFRIAHPALSATPHLAWSTPIGEGDSRRQRITAAPVVAGGLVYTLDAAARVSALRTDGTLAWSADLTPPQDDQEQATGGGLAYDGGTLYVSSGFGLLTALDAATGQQRWQQKLEATGSGQPTVYKGMIYLVAGDDTGWAIDTKDGRVAWQVSATPSVTNVLGAPAPALTPDLAIFAFGSGDLMATFRRGGLRRWYASVAGQRKGRAQALIMDVTGSPVVSGSRVYAGNHAGRTVAYELDTGERAWTAQEGALGPVLPAGDSIFAVTDRNQLVRLDSRDGSTVWAVNLSDYLANSSKRRGAVYANYGPILAGGRIVVASNDGYLRFFDPADGSLTASAEVPGGATTAPVVAGRTLYVVGAKGELHAFR